MRHRALFLDRDGVINLDHGYVSRRENFVFVDGIFALCRHAKRLGYLIIVVTNQAGIGRGYYTEQDFVQLTHWMCAVFADEGAAVDNVYFCPTHPIHGLGQYKADSYFRKPNPGMFLKAAEDFDVDLSQSVLIGDKETDIAAGLSAGIGCNLLYCTSNSSESVSTSANAVVDNFEQVLPHLAHS